jgi:hypothetical protein
MTDYNATVNNYEDYDGNSERHEGRITLDGVRLVWVYDGFNKALIHVACYQMLPTDAKMRTRNRLGDGTRLRRIPISKRSDFRAIRRAIGHEINKYHEDEEAYEALHPREDEAQQ